MTQPEEVRRAFHEAAGDPLAYLRRWKQRTGDRLIGVFPMEVPEEVLHAAGVHTVCLPGSDAPVSAAGELLHSVLCHPVRANLDLLLTHKLDFLDGLVLADVCDQAKRSAELWLASASLPFLFTLRLPRKRNSPAALSWLCHELERLQRALEGFTGHAVSTERLRQSIDLFNQQRSMLDELYRLRRESPLAFEPGEVEAVVAAAMVMPREEHVSLLSSYLDAKRPQVPTEEATGKVRVLLWGNPCEDLEPGLVPTLAAIGAVVVDDALHCGRMYFSHEVPVRPSPLDGLAEAFFSREPCPAIYGSQTDLAEHLLALARAAGAQGVVLLVPKFCEIYGFDYPYLAKRLEQEKLPHLMIETDHSGVGARGRSRLEAFVEAMRSS